jgi:hypothetical protein
MKNACIIKRVLTENGKQAFKFCHKGTVTCGLSLEPLKAITLFIIIYLTRQL